MKAKTFMIGAVMAVLLLPVASMKMQQVNITASPTTITAMTSAVPMAAGLQPMVGTAISLSVPVLTGPSMAGAECDPSGGRHIGLALKCFLEWLMEFTDA